MQDEKRYIVAVDLGSSHITGAVGHRDDDGRFTVDAVEIGESKDGIKRGRVINVSDVALKLSQIFRRLEARISPSKISKVYVGVSGQSIRSIEFPVVRTISSESPIDDSLLAELEAEARDRILENNLVVFDVIPGECRLPDISVRLMRRQWLFFPKKNAGKVALCSIAEPRQQPFRCIKTGILHP